MGSLIIKVSQNGSSRQYLFNKLGPITIGSDRDCDLVLEDLMEAKILEVKQSAGQIFVKDLSLEDELYLDASVLPRREEVRYEDAKMISIQDTNIQIQIYVEEVPEAPPVFFDEELNERLEQMSQRIRDKELNIREMDEECEKKKSWLEDIQRLIRNELDEKSALTREIENLKSKKEELGLELKKKSDLSEEKSEKLVLIQEHINTISEADRSVSESLLRQNVLLDRMKDEIERKNAEVAGHKERVSHLETEMRAMSNNMDDLQRQRIELENEMNLERTKMQEILAHTDQALKEKVRVSESISKLLREREDINVEIDRSKGNLKKVENSRKDAELRVHELKTVISKEEIRYKMLQDTCQDFEASERNLKSLNEDLRLELIKVEDRLTSKKNQFNQLDFQNLDAQKKLSAIQLEIDRYNNQLKSLMVDEKTHELKLMGLKKEVQIFFENAEEDKSRHFKEFEEQKRAQEDILKKTRSEISALRIEISEVEDRLKVSRELQEDRLRTNKSLEQNLSELQTQIGDLENKKSDMIQESALLREQYLTMNQEKTLIEKELSSLKIKLLDSSAMIQQKEQDAFLEMEKFKSEERAKIASEKTMLITEIDAQRQKMIIDVDAEYRRRHDELHGEKLDLQRKAAKVLGDAHSEAEIILSRARLFESETNHEATERLKIATLEANEREHKSHLRFEEAQKYFKEKEDEAHRILSESKSEAQSIVSKVDKELMDELILGKRKVKEFLAMKQRRSVQGLKTMEELHQHKMERTLKFAQEKFELLKRKELRKISDLRQEELTKKNDLKESILKDLKEEKEKTHLYIQNLRRKQEAELAETKKAVLDHLNQTKTKQQKACEEEIQREKNLYNQTKKQRLEIATQAVMNVLIGENSSEIYLSEDVKAKIHSSLELAINGQNPETVKQVEQILDFNPLKKKEFMPVFKKWILRVGVPTAAAVVIMADVAGVRTSIVDYSKGLMKQQRSAADTFVKNQQEEWKQKYTYAPATTPGHKDTFTDNVLYTTDYAAVVENEAFQNQWILDLHNFMVKDLELSEDVAISYISSEGSLVKEMFNIKKDINPQFEDIGINKLKELEKTSMSWLDEKLSDPAKKEKFLAFRKNFYDQYYKEKHLPQRGIASEKAPEALPNP